MEKEDNKKFSIWAILGFIAGLLSFMYWVSVVGVLLNIGALIQISKTKQKGKVLAIIGLILSALLLLLVATGHFWFSL